MHAIQRRLWAEELLRLRGADERRRRAAAQRRGRIDPNPHQVDAVQFALRRIPQGGCILADEVGLGKTIEAGLVIAQLLAEGAERILLILPKALIGQWQNELLDLFGLETRDDGGESGLYDGPGIFTVGREAAGSDRVGGLLKTANPFDLCVIDEAHEIFAGIHKRFDREGEYKEEADAATTAHNVRKMLGNTPTLLLTATPIQNSLRELWGLAQYVEPTGTLLGNLPTFRELFCEDGDGRRVIPEQAEELRKRVNTICQRTLRRQAQEFLEKPFTRRQARLFNYEMSPEEKSLYDDITDYLLEPTIHAFSGNSRRLLLIGFHRRMASSVAALAASLEKVAERLRKKIAGDEPTGVAEESFALDLEAEGLPSVESADDTIPEAEADPGALEAELARVVGFIERARGLERDTKFEQALIAVRKILKRGETEQGSGKVVIFTESVTTQGYLRERLIASDLGLTDADITLFSGANDSARAREALAIWREEAGQRSSGTGASREVATRLALVHEFRERSKVFISTEAGAKGLNLQFCDTIINYDLPWNPQRIEQRIGRCHRYSQRHDVTVINFIAKDNEAERLTFEILSAKLELFGQVLDASDVTLHESRLEAPETLATALGPDFERQLQTIYDRARTREEILEEIRGLSERMDQDRERFTSEQNRMASIIESRLDDSVRQVFRQIADDLPEELARFDAEMERTAREYLERHAVEHMRRQNKDGRVVYTFPKNCAWERYAGKKVIFGSGPELKNSSFAHLGHPLMVEAIQDARRSTAGALKVRFRIDANDPELAAWIGRRGRLRICKARHSGFETIERILPIAVDEDEAAPLEASLTRRLLAGVIEDAPDLPDVPALDGALDEALAVAMFLEEGEIEKTEQLRYEQLSRQLERFAEDQILIQERRLREQTEKLSEAQHEKESSVSADRRRRATERAQKIESAIESLQATIDRLRCREDEDYIRWRNYLQERRFRKPEIELILETEWIVDETGGE